MSILDLFGGMIVGFSVAYVGWIWDIRKYEIALKNRPDQ